MSIQSLVLTDGTTTATLSDGTNYALVGDGWAPNVVPVERGTLGTYSNYGTVEDVFQLDIFSTPKVIATTLTNIARLQQLVSQAYEWERGSEVAAVRLQITMSGGTMKETVVVGGMLELPSNYADLLVVQEVAAATLRVRHREWLGAAESATTNTVQGANMLSLTWATAPRGPSQARVTINTGATSATNPSLPASFLIAAPQTSHISIVDSSSFGAGAGVSFSDGALSRGGTVHRFTPTNTAVQQSVPASIAMPAGVHHVFAAVRNNSASATYSFSIGLFDASNAYWSNRSGTPFYHVPPGTTNPQLVYLGRIGNRYFNRYINWAIKASTVNGSFDLDYLVFARDVPTTQIVSLLRANRLDALNDGLGSGGIAVVLDPQTLTSPAPSVYVRDSGDRRSELVYLGAPVMLTQGTSMAFFWMITRDDNWQFSRLSDGTLNSVTIAVERRPAFQVPE